MFFFILFAFFIGVGAYYINQGDKISESYDSRISYYSRIIMGCLFVSLILCFLFVVLIRFMPNCMVYALIILTLLIIFAIGIILAMYNLIILAIPIFIIFVVYSIFIYYLRKKIDLGLIIIRVALQFITEKFGIFIVPILKAITNILFTLFWIFSFISIILVFFNNKRLD